MTRRRRPWTYEDVTKLVSMAQKYSSAQIASEIGHPIASVRTKAHDLAISLRMDGARDRQSITGLGLRPARLTFGARPSVSVLALRGSALHMISSPKRKSREAPSEAPLYAWRSKGSDWCRSGWL
jgi:hypothetical protein